MQLNFYTFHHSAYMHVHVFVRVHMCLYVWYCCVYACVCVLCVNLCVCVDVYVFVWVCVTTLASMHTQSVYACTHHPTTTSAENHKNVLYIYVHAYINNEQFCLGCQLILRT